MQCQAVALSHKKKTAGRPPDWPEENESDAEWERLACNEVIWEEMINADTNALKVADKCNEEVAPDAKKTGEEDTLDVEKIQQVVAYGKEVTLDAGRAGEEDTLNVEKDSNALKRVHGERSEGTTGQQRTVYTMATGPNTTTGQQVRVKSMIDSGNTLRYGVAITNEFRRKLGLRYDSMRSKTVGTADKTGKMTQLGISKKFTLKIDGIRGY